MAVAEVSVMPIRKNAASLSAGIAACLGILRDSGLKHELHAMGTVIQGDVNEILDVVGRMHRAATKQEDVWRVVTTLTIDERTDQRLTMEGKVDAVKKKLAG